MSPGTGVTFTIDVVAGVMQPQVDMTGGLAGVGFDLVYDPTKLTVARILRATHNEIPAGSTPAGCPRTNDQALPPRDDDGKIRRCHGRVVGQDIDRPGDRLASEAADDT